MKLTKQILKRIIKEELMKENKSRASKIFDMLFPNGQSTDSEEMYNQAVMLTAGANLLDEVVKMWEDMIKERETRGEREGYNMGHDVFDRDWFYIEIDKLNSKKEKFIDDVMKQGR